MISSLRSTLLLAGFFITVFAQILPGQSHPDDVYWDKRFIATGLNGPVYSVATSGDNVYLAGTFSEGNGVTARNIVAWNSTTYTWSPLGDGVNGQIFTMVVAGQDLYVGGEFSQAGGQPASNIARWNITTGTWHPVGTGADLIVRKMVVHKGGLYVGGDFKRIGNLSTPALARLDLTSGTWSALATELRAPNSSTESVSAIAFQGDDLYIGGAFDIIDGKIAANVARKTAAGWSSLGTGTNPGVSGRANAFAFRGNEVYVGGDFVAAGYNLGQNYVTITNNIAMWNSQTGLWDHLIPSGTNTNHNPRGSINQLLIHNGFLYAVGTFSQFNDVVSGGIARYDFLRQSTSWSAVGGGITGEGYAMAVLNGDLVVGGTFATAGTVAAGQVAIFNGSAWSPLTNIPDNGTNGIIRTSAIIGNDLYVGGEFTVAGGRRASGVARWDGTRWNPLGVGVDGRVMALAVSGNNLYVAGEFDSAGGAPARNIARWNITNSTWSPMGGGLSAPVLALAVDGSTLYAGGAFNTGSLRYIAQWKGASWDSVGSGTNDTVRALAVAAGTLYAGGHFSTAGGVAAARVAQFNSATNTWAPMGTGLGGGVAGFERAYTLFAGGDFVYVGGEFTTAGGVNSGYVARWSRSANAWSNLGPGFGKGPCDAVHAIALNGADIYLGGTFILAGETPVNKIVRYDGTGWKPLGTELANGVNNQIYTIAFTNGKLFAAGSFTATANGFVNRIARFDGSSWFPLGGSVTSGLNAPVYAIAFDGEDVYLGGNFTATGTSTANYIIKWNNATGTWSSLGSGTTGPVNAIAVSNGKLYVGGSFDGAGDVLARNVAVWDPASGRWSPLGGVPGNGVNAPVFALAVQGEIVYVGGLFSRADTLAATRLASWDNSTGRWRALGAGADSTVLSMTISGNYLYVAGEFRKIDGVASNYIARWHMRDRKWERLGGGTNAPVRSLASDGNSVYLAGDFVVAGTISARHVARWDNEVGYFSRLGDGVSGDIYSTAYAVAVNRGRVYVGGEFYLAGTDSAYHIAQWDSAGQKWRQMGSGIGGVGTAPTVYALATKGGDVYAGGGFNRAGGAPSYFIAHWEAPFASVDPPVVGLEPSAELLYAFPNPFSNRSTIHFRLAQAGEVDLKVYNAHGVEVSTLLSKTLPAGAQSIEWDAAGLPAGVYYYHLRHNGMTAAHSIVLVR